MQLSATNTAVVLDSTADYPGGPERFPNWRIVPLYVRFGGESFRDYAELGPQDFYQRLRTAPDLPTTSQPTPGDFLEAYRGLEQYDRILSLHIPATLSGTVESARMAGEELGGGKVRAIDSGTVSTGLALLALGVQERLERGTTDEEVDAYVERFRRENRIVFTVDTLEYLARGGRIGKAAAMAGTLLNIKPILAIEHGEVVPVKRVRGAHKAFLEFVEAFEQGSADRPSLRVGIADAEAPDRRDAIRELVRRTRPQARIEVETTLGAVVGTHAGPGAVGFFWFDESD
ncbi:MAG TPA: DegV family protein [Gaiellaceae bacterium]|jgi:DegV family protein with EDD domain